MRTGIFFTLEPPDRRRLEAIARDRNAPQKHVWRVVIVLHSADGLGTAEIMRRTGKSKTCEWRWQERFMAEGAEGLLRDKTRPSPVPPLAQAVIDEVVTLTATEPPHQATHWTSAATASPPSTAISKRPTTSPNVWTADPDKIIAAVNRGHQALDSIH